jgi:hypothetical protein
MRTRLRKWWPLLKALLAIAILIAIGRQFAHALQIPERGFKPALEDLWTRIVHPWWLVLSGCLYLLGLGLSAVYWFGLLRALDQQPTFLSAVRAHFIGQMGKYLPGKAWALVLRGSEVKDAGVHLGVAVMTSFYDVLTTMSAGALTAAILFGLEVSDWSTAVNWADFGRILPLESALGAPVDGRVMFLLSLLLLLPVGVPIVPRVFNWIVHRIALPFRESDAVPMPQVRSDLLLWGLPLTAVSWFLMGMSLWAVLLAALPTPLAWSWQTLEHLTAFVAVSYVGSFLIFFIPSGFGVREYLLLLLLIPELKHLGLSETDAGATAFSAAFLLRLVWMAAEVVFVAMVYWLPVEKARRKEMGERQPTLAT